MFIFKPNPLQGAFMLKPPEGGSFAFSIPQAQFILNSNSTGATGTSGVVSATYPLVYNSTDKVISITPNYYYLNTNPSGFITSSALVPYLLSTTAASTYYPLTNPSNFITAAALSGYATESFVTSQGYITSAALTPYLTSADAATTYYLQTNPSGFITSAALVGYATETWVGEQDYATNTSLANYLPLAGGTMTGGINLPDAGGSIGYDEFLGTGYLILNKPSDGAVMEFTATGILFPDGNTQTVAYNLTNLASAFGASPTGSATFVTVNPPTSGQFLYYDGTYLNWGAAPNPFDQDLNTTDSVRFTTAHATDNSAAFPTSSIMGAWLFASSKGWYFDYSGNLRVEDNSGSPSAIQISGTSITFPDATVQTTAWTGSYNPFDQNLNIGDGVSFGSVTITDASTNLTLSGSIQFGDASVQTTAFPPTGGTTLDYIDGTGALQTFPAGGAASRLETTVYNNSGATIPQHSVVYINGRHGNDPTIALAQANAEATSRATFGFTKNAISNNSLGTVVQVGLLEDVHYTISVSEGALLFLDPTVAGRWTDIQPYSPNHYVNVGTAIRVHPTQGTIQVRIQNSNELNELSDVQVSSAVAGDLLVSNGSGYWVSQSLATAGIAPVASPTFTGTVTIPAGASISGFAPLASPTFTGDPKAPTPTAGDNDTSIATTAFVNTAISAIPAAPPVIDIQTFGSAGATSTVTGTWTKPAGAKMVEIHMWGAGGGGGGGGCNDPATTARTGGGGGSAGAYSVYRVPASDLDATCVYGCPVGGAGGAGKSTAGSPSAGGNTVTTNGSPYFTAKASPSTLYRSLGGIGGAATTGTGGAGGIGSLLNLAPTTTTNNGGGGTTGAGTSAGTVTNGAFMGGSGGGGAGAAAGSTTAANGGAGTSRNAGSNNGISTALAGGTGGTGATPVPATAGTAGDQAFASGMGGGGGYYKTGVAGGTGGAGGYPSGGGGGGGASDLGFLSGAGGKGGNSRIVVITYF